MNNLYILSLHESSSGYTFFKSSKKSLQEPVVDRVNEIPIKKKTRGQVVYDFGAKQKNYYLHILGIVKRGSIGGTISGDLH